MQSHQHYKVVCKCGTVMQQCRCPAPDKTELTGTCEKCLKKPLGEVLEVVKNKPPIALGIGILIGGST